MGDGFVGGNSINKKRVPFSICSKQSYRAMPVQPSAHLNPSINHPVIMMVLSTLSPLSQHGHAIDQHEPVGLDVYPIR